MQVLRTQNFRDVVPKIPGVTKEELEGVDVEYDGMEYLASLNLVGRVLKPFWIARYAGR